MKIAMFTNTYLPHVGGVANSVKSFEDEFRKLGHEVIVVAPEFSGEKDPAPSVLRVQALQNFNGSDFSVCLRVPSSVSERLEEFAPDVIHSHHPFLLGDAALRTAFQLAVPIVFTHHTLYENYTHYVPLDSDALKRAAITLAVEYANLCTAVIAPSESVRRLLEARGVTSMMEAIPTGVDLERFRRGNGETFRRKHGLPEDAVVLGHVGRLAEEKNLAYLAEALGKSLDRLENTVALIVGDGDASEIVAQKLAPWAERGRVFMPGKLTGRDLVNAYAAMDVFGFSSQSETQGMVLAEAMASGTPIVALDAPGVREIVRDRENGRLLAKASSTGEFADALVALVRDEEFFEASADAARRTARDFSNRNCARRVLAFYERARRSFRAELDPDAHTGWNGVLSRIEFEWDLLREKLSSAAALTLPSSAKEVKLA